MHRYSGRGIEHGDALRKYCFQEIGCDNKGEDMEHSPNVRLHLCVIASTLQHRDYLASLSLLS